MSNIGLQRNVPPIGQKNLNLYTKSLEVAYLKTTSSLNSDREGDDDITRNRHPRPSYGQALQNPPEAA